MLTFAQEQTPAQQTKSADSKSWNGAVPSQHIQESSIVHLQRTIGNRAVQQLLQQAKPDSRPDEEHGRLKTKAAGSSKAGQRAVPPIVHETGGVGLQRQAACDPGHTQSIGDALNRASPWRTKVLAGLNKYKGDLDKFLAGGQLNESLLPFVDKMNAHFNFLEKVTTVNAASLRANASTVRSAFDDIIKGFDGIALNPALLCAPNQSRLNICGESKPGSAVITIFEECFDRQQADGQTCVAFHEAAHASSEEFTGDSYRGLDENYPGLYGSARHNADSYANYAALINTGAVCSAVGEVAGEEMEVKGKP